MITLTTGSPGTGKTLSVVSEILLQREEKFAGRKIFVHGIPELAVETDPIPEGHTIHDMNVWLQWPENQGSIVIVDEAQNVFPPRSSNSKAPELVEWLHVHRHSGVDLYLISQMPSRIDKQVRDLVGAHYHLHKNALGTTIKYFWDYCATNPKSEFRHAQIKVYRLDKKAFGVYKSATIHTKIKTPKSKLRWFIPLVLISTIVFLYMSFKKVTGIESDSMGAKAASAAAAVPVSASGVTNGVAAYGASVGEQVGRKLQPLTAEQLKPVLEEHPESKPLYDAVRKVQAFEFPVACVDTGSGCNCYSEQGTKLKEISIKTCKTYVADGMPFNPYKRAENRQNQRDNDDGQGVGMDSGQIAVLSGKSPPNLMYDNLPPAGQPSPSATAAAPATPNPLGG